MLSLGWINSIGSIDECGAGEAEHGTNPKFYASQIVQQGRTSAKLKRRWRNCLQESNDFSSMYPPPHPQLRNSLLHYSSSCHPTTNSLSFIIVLTFKLLSRFSRPFVVHFTTEYYNSYVIIILIRAKKYPAIFFLKGKMDGWLREGGGGEESETPKNRGSFFKPLW